MRLICWRGLAVLVPEVGSAAERKKERTWEPEPEGSNAGSPVGTGTSKLSVVPEASS